MKLLALFRNVCPHCGNSPIFRGLYRMTSACPACGEPFERESGYFIGAMIASYFLGVFLVFPVLLAAIFFFQLEVAPAIALAVVLLLAFQPFLFRYSRILWIQVEARLTRSIHKGP